MTGVECAKLLDLMALKVNWDFKDEPESEFSKLPYTERASKSNIQQLAQNP